MESGMESDETHHLPLSYLQNCDTGIPLDGADGAPAVMAGIP
jgi:hypothetical protein